MEKAVVFGPERSLVGVWTEPAAPVPGNERVAVIMINSGIIHHAGAWRLHVRVARALAEIGVASLRFDLSGIGDSGYGLQPESLNESVLRDMDEAIQYVGETRGWRRIVMMGLCSGAVDAIQAAHRQDAVVGAIAIDLLGDFRNWRHYAVHYGHRLLRVESWKSTVLLKNGTIERWFRAAAARLTPGSTPNEDPPQLDGGRRPMTRQEVGNTLRVLVGRDVKLLCAFSSGLEDNYNHHGQFAEVFPGLAADPRTTVVFFRDADHTFSDREQQRGLITLIVDWMETAFGEAREGSVGGFPPASAASGGAGPGSEGEMHTLERG